MSRINDSVLWPRYQGPKFLSSLFTAFSVLVYAATIVVIIAALTVGPGVTYQAKQIPAQVAPAVWDGTALLLGLPLP